MMVRTVTQKRPDLNQATTCKDWLTQAIVGKVDKMENENGRVAIKPSRTARKRSKAV
jgi:hypothetical protein